MKKIFALVIALTLSAGTPAVALDVLSDKECKEIKDDIGILIASVQTYEAFIHHYNELQDKGANAKAKALGERNEQKYKKLRDKELSVLADYSTVYGHLCKN